MGYRRIESKERFARIASMLNHAGKAISEHCDEIGVHDFRYCQLEIDDFGDEREPPIPHWVQCQKKIFHNHGQLAVELRGLAREIRNLEGEVRRLKSENQD